MAVVIDLLCDSYKNSGILERVAPSGKGGGNVRPGKKLK